MKKYIIAIIALACAATGFAKTADELYKEFEAIKNSPDNWRLCTAWTAENLADLKAAWQQYKTSPYMQPYSVSRAERIKSGEEAFRAGYAKRAMFAYLFAKLGADFDASDAVKFSLQPNRFKKLNPSKWAELERNGFKSIDGIEITAPERLYAGWSTRNLAVVYEARAEFERWDKSGLEENLAQMRSFLLKAEDLDKAKAICDAYESAMLLCDCPNADKIQAVGKVLTARIVDAKIAR